MVRLCGGWCLCSAPRREFGKVAIATAPAVALAGNPLFGAVQARPNSIISGVRVGTITYSYRSMPDQSAEATLKYLVESGISQVELMGGPIESYGGIPDAAGRGVVVAQVAPDEAEQDVAGRPGDIDGLMERHPVCPGRGWVAAAGGRAAPVVVATQMAPAGPAAPAPAGGGGGGRGGAQTPEQIAFADSVRKWRTSVSMDKFKALRKMYNDAGVTIYATKMLGTEHERRRDGVRVQRG